MSDFCAMSVCRRKDVEGERTESGLPSARGGVCVGLPVALRGPLVGVDGQHGFPLIVQNFDSPVHILLLHLAAFEGAEAILLAGSQSAEAVLLPFNLVDRCRSCCPDA